MGQNDWLIILSTLLGPILAVQAQKWIERARAATQRRERIFSVLMATRQSRISLDHVRALNSIDLAFYGRRALGRVWRGSKAQSVVDAWHDYHAHLSLPSERRPKNPEEQRAWDASADELFVNLLDRLAIATDYKFERSQLKTGSYSPEAHGNAELENQAIKRTLIEVLAGQRPVPFEIRSWPVDPAAAEQQIRTQQQIAAALEDIARNGATIVRPREAHSEEAPQA